MSITESADDLDHRLQPQAELAACDREAIHRPGSIQPHGVLLVLSPDLGRIVQASANAAEVLGRPDGAVTGASLSDLLAADEAREVLRRLASPQLEQTPTDLGLVQARDGAQVFHAIGHRAGGQPVLELEVGPHASQATFNDLYHLVQLFMLGMQKADDVAGLCGLASREIRRITDFDRVLVYRFDADWNGTVVAEDRNDRLPSYLGLRFPATDIPRQARELYRVNRLRLIPDADYQPVPLEPAVNPTTGEPLDMSFATLRSVSPVHVAYMRNMGTPASMSISIVREDRLWGLISCHHAQPRRVPYAVRTACHFLAQVMSMEITGREHSEENTLRMGLKRLESRLLSHMAASDNFLDGLISQPADLLGIVEATGAAVVASDGVRLVGETPSAEDVRHLADWLARGEARDVFFTHELPRLLPEAARYKSRAAGLLAVSISEVHQDFVLWFRPEVVRTVHWGGDPRKPVEHRGDGPWGLHPRNSFELWKQVVQDQSEPWQAIQVQAANDLQNGIISIVLRKAEELAALSQQLEVSNRDLEAFSYSVSHDLRAPFRHITGYSELLKELEAPHLSDMGKRYIDTIIESAQYAGKLVDNLLAFSKMNRQGLQISEVDLNRLAEDVRRRFDRDSRQARAGHQILWEMEKLPTVHADPFMLRLVVENLFSNAVKYSRDRDEAVIRVSCTEEKARWVIQVSDNGVGFDMRYVNKLFGVFQRLHRMEDFEGTGIGLANVRRIITRHGGETWAEGEVDKGATFYFTLPKVQHSESDRG